MGLDLAEVCRQIYVDTLEMREKHKAGLGPLYDFAFKILHAPPRAHPPVLFIGIQPGGDKADTASREMFTWPDKLDYETGDWPLANYIRNLFKDHLDVLRACNVTNANFFRSPRQRKDPKKPQQLYWGCADLSTRKILKAFCEEKLKIVVEQLHPKVIVVTGKVLLLPKLWQSGVPEWNGKGTLFGVRAIRVKHTNAARYLSKTDGGDQFVCHSD